MKRLLRILIVEDSENDSQLLVRELQRGGYEMEYERVETANAMRLALAQKSWDLVLSDYSLPQFSALGALDVLKASEQDLPFIVISGTIDEETAVSALRAGANDFVLKGRFARLGPAIERELREAESRRGRKQAEKALQASESRYRRLFESNPQPMWVYDLQTLQFLAVNNAAVEHYGYSRTEFLSMTIREIWPAEDLTAFMANITEVQQDLQTPIAGKHLKKDGSSIDVEISYHSVEWEGRPARLVLANDVTERKESELRIQQLTRLYATLSQVNNTIVRVRDRRELFQTICQVAVDHGKFAWAWIGLFEKKTGRITPVAHHGAAQTQLPFQEININERPFSQGIIASAVKARQIAYSPVIQTSPDLQHWRETAIAGDFHSAAAIPFRLNGEIFGLLNLYATEVDFFADPEQQNLLEEMSQDISYALDRIELQARRRRAEQELQEKERLLSEAQRIGHIGSWSYDIGNDALQFSDEMYRLLDVSPEQFEHRSEALLRLIFPSDRPMVANWLQDIRGGRQVREIEFLVLRKNSELRYLWCTGAVEFAGTGKPTRFVGTAQDITERKFAEIQIRQQIEQLTALRNIDQAILSSFDLNVTLDILLSEVISQLHVDAADILLLEPDGQMLAYAGGKGFRTNAVESTRLRLVDSQAARERRLIHVENLKYKPDMRLLASPGASEGFVSYIGVPLLVKGRLKGLLEVFQRAPLHTYPEWLDFLNALAGQSAIAIETATLIENLEQSNRELSQAYDATIEGWSRALDLRDRETEGHTQRVTAMTLKLALAYGLPDEDLLHIRRGALLHDIGKMGVPDHILLKPGELTEEEWSRMKTHPEYAYNLLKPIAFLEPALDIPYYHHEKWNGTGYPLGLRGQEIPLVARLFAVVDVWDAIRSDRPYRAAWSKEKALEHIKSLSGIYFDPHVVEAFLKLLKEQDAI